MSHSVRTAERWYQGSLGLPQAIGIAGRLRSAASTSAAATAGQSGQLGNLSHTEACNESSENCESTAVGAEMVVGGEENTDAGESMGVEDDLEPDCNVSKEHKPVMSKRKKSHAFVQQYLDLHLTKTDDYI